MDRLSNRGIDSVCEHELYPPWTHADGSTPEVIPAEADRHLIAVDRIDLRASKLLCREPVQLGTPRLLAALSRDVCRFLRIHEPWDLGRPWTGPWKSAGSGDGRRGLRPPRTGRRYGGRVLRGQAEGSVVGIHPSKKPVEVLELCVWNLDGAQVCHPGTVSDHGEPLDDLDLCHECDSEPTAPEHESARVLPWQLRMEEEVDTSRLQPDGLSPMLVAIAPDRCRHRLAHAPPEGSLDVVGQPDTTIPSTRDRLSTAVSEGELSETETTIPFADSRLGASQVTVHLSGSASPWPSRELSVCG